MSSNTAQRKYSSFGPPFLEQSSSLSPHQQQTHQLEPHEQESFKRLLQSKPYPPILPNTTVDTHPFNPHPFETPMEVDRERKNMTNIRACDICRRRKVRCVGNGVGSACKNCRANNTECTYNERAKKRGPPKGYKADLNNRLKRLETLLGGMTNDDHTARATSGGKANSASISPQSSASNVSPSTNSLSTSNIVTNSTSSKCGTDTSSPVSDCQQQHQQVTEAPRSMIEGQPRYVDDVGILPFLAVKFNIQDERLTSSITTKIRRLGQAIVVTDEEGDATNGRTLNQLLLEDIGVLKPGETIASMDDWILKVAGISKNTSDQLMQIYFTYIHPGLPVVNKTLLLNQYRGFANDYPPAPLLNAMYGAAARYIEKCEAIDDGVAILEAFDKRLGKWEMPQGGSEGFYGRLMKYIKGIYVSSITTVQAMVIAQNHRMGTENGMPCDWLICAAAVRMAQDLGLQRSCEALDISENEKETRRRVWWAVYIMDRWAAASTGRPQTIFDEDCDQDYPSDSASWEEVMDVAPDCRTDDQQLRFSSLDPSIAKKVKGEKIPLYQPFVQIAKLSEILGRILQGLYTPLGKKHSVMFGSDVIVAELDKALSDWRSALPPTLQLSGTNLQSLDSSGRTPLLTISVLLYLAYCTLLILLHRPFIVKNSEPATRSSEASLSICISAATRCVDVASAFQLRDFLLVSWNFVIYHVFTASMIHGHTALYSDSVIADVAKTQLIKSLRVLNKLSRFSTKASQLHQVLLQLMHSRGLPMDNPLAKHDITPHQTSDESMQENGTALSTPPHYIETTDISSGKLANDLGSNSQSALHSIQHHNERPNKDSSHSISMMNDNWINGLCSSFQQDNQQASIINTNPDLESDPNSLQQFGLNIEQMFTPLEQIYSMDHVSNSMPTDQSQQLAYTTAGLPGNFPFGLPSTEHTEQRFQRQNTISGFNLFPGTSSSASQQYGQPGDNVLLGPNNLAPTVDNSIFRNRPDNPFWSVPSSLEMDDWNTFLLHPRFNGNDDF